MNLENLLAELRSMPEPERIEELNRIRVALHEISPFAAEPVDLVIWAKSDSVSSNDYNPNTVAPPEMRLLEHSIKEDGYTQPIVAWRNNGHFEVVDGFHRNRVGRESIEVRERIKGYLPLSVINPSKEDRGARIAATIRHNRARGKHQVSAMSDIVIELKRRNWTNERIARDLGMDQDEILRLCQITGLAEMFSDKKFSSSWDVEGHVSEEEIAAGISDDISTYGPEADEFRTVNTSDPGRIFHTHDKWECYKAGFYSPTLSGVTAEECERMYASFLANEEAFSSALDCVISEWKNSCEHYLTNTAMNRIAWLGQASACYAMGIPSNFRSGFNLLTEEEAAKANEIALKYLNIWLQRNARPEIDMDSAISGERQSDIY